MLTDFYLKDIECGKYQLVFASAVNVFNEANFFVYEKKSHTVSLEYAGLYQTNYGG